MIDPIPDLPLSKLPLEELFLMMSYKDDDVLQANTAFAEFHRRFKDFFWNYCQRSCKKLEGYYHEPALTIFDNVMNKVYFKAGSLLKISAPTEEAMNNIMKGWLAQTAAREIIDLYDDNKQFAEMHDLKDDDEKLDEIMETWQAKSTDEYKISPESEFIDTALGLLKEREQHIYIELLGLDEENKYLPKEDVKRLADHYGITQGNLYQIRHRATTKINEFINARTKPTGHGTLRIIPRREED
jgi:hypothetical protein